jgi:hypothetical protein
MNEKVKGQVNKVVEAKNRAAVQEQFAPDYMEVKGVKFYKPKLAHVWPLSRIQALEMPPMDRAIVIAYALTHDQESTRNVLMREITKGEVVDRAYAFFQDNNLGPEEVGKVADEYGGEALKLVNGETEEEKDPEKKTTE